MTETRRDLTTALMSVGLLACKSVLTSELRMDQRKDRRTVLMRANSMALPKDGKMALRRKVFLLGIRREQLKGGQLVWP